MTVRFPTTSAIAGDLYGMVTDLTFEGRLREERRFDSVDALRAQIERDVDQARLELKL